MEQKKGKVVKIIVGVVCVLMIVAGSFWTGFAVRGSTMDKELSTINYILSMYKKYYYDEVSSDEIIKRFEDSLLDIYSDYYTAEEYEQEFKVAQGSHEGIGISYSPDTFEIASVVWNSPADRSGMRAGGVISGYKLNENDQMIAIAPDSLGEFKDLNTLFSSIPAYTDFILELDYNGTKENVIVAREEYTETFVRYYSVDGEFGYREIDGEMKYVRIGDNNVYDLGGRGDVAVIDYNGFQGLRDGLYGSAGQMKHALEQFASQGKKNLILDLRNNGGGFMDILCDVASHLVGAKQGEKAGISVVADKHGKTETFNSPKVDSDKFGYENIIILGNTGTASASEALIGAMLDYDNKNIVKVVLEGFSYKQANYDKDIIEIKTEYRTYGKGIMQSTFENVFTGEAIKLTTNKIFWPVSNITIHGVGVTTSLNEKYGTEKIYNESEKGCVYDALSLLK